MICIMYLVLMLMKEVDITTDAIMTEDEIKAFQKSGGNTQIIRRQSSIMGNASEEDLNPSGVKVVGATPSDSSTKKRKLFGLL